MVRNWKKEDKGSNLDGKQFKESLYFLSYEIFESVSRLCVH